MFYIRATIYKEYHCKKSVSYAALKVIAPLINQNINKKFNLLFSIWSLLCLVLSNSFSNNILYSIYNHELLVLNTMQQLMDSDMKVVISVDSWLAGEVARETHQNPNIKKFKDQGRIGYGDAAWNKVCISKLLI